MVPSLVTYMYVDLTLVNPKPVYSDIAKTWYPVQYLLKKFSDKDTCIKASDMPIPKEVF